MKNILVRSLLFGLLLPGLAMGQELTRTKTVATTPATTDASSLSAGTLPDARLSSNVVTLNGAQNLLNKTLTSPTISGTVTGPLFVNGAGTFTGNLTVGNGTTGTINLGDGSFTKASGSQWNFNGGVISNTINATGYFATTNAAMSTTGGSVGMKWQSPAFVANDPTTAANGTAATSTNFSLGPPTLTATNTNVTTTEAVNLRILGPPIAGTNQAITKAYSFKVDAGDSFFGGNIILPSTASIGTASNAVNTIFNSGNIYTRLLTAYDTQGLTFSNNSATGRFKLFDSGNFVIGGAVPADNGTDKLQVGGSINATTGITAGGAITAGGFYSSAYRSNASNMLFGSSGGTAWGQFYQATGNLVLQTGGTLADDGTNKLQLNGDISFTGSNPKLKFGNSIFAHNLGTGNLFVGLSAGNLTLTGSGNTVLGPSAGTGITTASNNTFIGYVAGQGVTAGQSNVIIGSSAGNTNDNSNNVIIGGFAANNKNVFSNSTLLGKDAGRNVAGTGYSNVIYIGADAGNGIGSESNTFRVGAPSTPVSATITGNVTVNGTNASPVLALTDGATVTWDSNTGNEKVLTLTGIGRTLTITNPLPGAFYTLKIIQDATGSRTITTYPTNTKWPGGVVPTLTATAGGVDILTFFYDGTNFNAIATNDFK